jgi:nucleoside-diphosphate-sugar epimerase
MKVLIAGATGAVGKPLLRSLDNAGHKTFAIVRSRKPVGTFEARSTKEVVADVLDAASVLEAVHRALGCRADTHVGSCRDSSCLVERMQKRGADLRTYSGVAPHEEFVPLRLKPAPQKVVG